MADKNHFRKNGLMRVRFETPEERSEIIRLLEDQLGFKISDDLKNLKKIGKHDTRTFDIDLKCKKYTYGIQPFIGAAMCSNGVRFYSAQEFFKIAELNFKTEPRYLIFHVPHDGWRFPEELVSSVCIPEADFMRYHETMRDAEIGKIIPECYRTQNMHFRFDISRLLCDVERFTGPDEIMERYGMGFCYEKVYDGTRIKDVTQELKEKTLTYYLEHHQRIDRICRQSARILLFDIHSYSDEIVPKDFLKKGIPTPDICIGTDEYFTPPELEHIVRHRFEKAGYQVAVNYPYIGTYIPDAVLADNNLCDCASIMLEVNKRIYCDPNGAASDKKLNRLQNILQKIIVYCVDQK